jgi:hypothetical protein
MSFSFEVESCQMRCSFLLLPDQFPALFDARLYDRRSHLHEIDRFLVPAWQLYFGQARLLNQH